jgi:hypothetical protein
MITAVERAIAVREFDWEEEEKLNIYIGRSNFLSETPEIYKIAISKPLMTGPTAASPSRVPAVEPRKKIARTRRNNPSRDTHY